MLADIIDMISNAYYLKISLNRISDNTIEDLSSFEMPEEILETVSQINIFISQAKKFVDSLQKAVPNLCICGKLSKFECPVIQKQLFGIQELIEKFEKTNWDPIYIKLKIE